MVASEGRIRQVMIRLELFFWLMPLDIMEAKFRAHLKTPGTECCSDVSRSFSRPLSGPSSCQSIRKGAMMLFNFGLLSQYSESDLLRK